MHITDGSVVGYKYFDMGKSHRRKNLRLEMNFTPLGKDAKVEVWTKRPSAAEGGVAMSGKRTAGRNRRHSGKLNRDHAQRAIHIELPHVGHYTTNAASRD